MNDAKKIAAVVGIGPGLGSAIARRFAREGFAVALMARQAASCEAVLQQITTAGGEAHAFAVDTTDPSSVAAGFDAVRASMGDPEVLVYNVGAFVLGAVLDLSPETFESAWKGNCFGGFLAARACVPG